MDINFIVARFVIFFAFFITKVLFFSIFLCIMCLMKSDIILFFRLFYEFTLKLLLFHVFYIKFNQLKSLYKILTYIKGICL